MVACAEGPPQLAQSVALPPRSLLMFRGAAYTDCLHGVREAKHFTFTFLLARMQPSSESGMG